MEERERDVSDDGAVAAGNENCADFVRDCCIVGDGEKEKINFCAGDIVKSGGEHLDVNVCGVEKENTVIYED